jgi:hypothetical protein
MADELTRPNKFGGGALVVSGILFVVLAFLDFRASPPPSNGTTAALDIIGSYRWAIGPVLTLICQLSFGGWFVAVGSQLFRMRGSAA